MLRIGFCDDDLSVLNTLQVLLDRYRVDRNADLSSAAFQSPLELIAEIEKGLRFDILLLDVLMPGENGMEAAREIRRFDSSVKIIFLTSSTEFAVESYSVGAYFYQLKPIWAESFYRLMDSVIAECDKSSSSSLILRCKSGITRVELEKLSYCEVQGRSLWLHLEDGTVLESTGSMDHLCEQLTGYEQFFRLHRSFLVNLEHIKRIAPKAITMTDDTELPLPRGKYTEVKDLYLEYAFRRKQVFLTCTPLYICNTVAVGLFGIVLSAAFCNITWSRRKVLEMALFTLGIFLLQAVVYFGITPELGQYLYPLHTHLPLILILCLLSRQRLWPVISVLTAYLCCQLRRWLALLIVELCAGGDAMQQAVELALTVPLLLLLLRAAPAVRSVSQYPAPIQCQFGIIPAVYYAFDYLTRVYTNLLSSGSPTVVEFMPFVCSVAYLIFVFRLSEEQRARTYLEQMQNSLNLQVHQAVREIEAMRESQNKTRAYRHDLRHHLQYLSACLENGQYTQAQSYIRSISDEIEASRVTVYCENEAANLIFSSFAGRAAAKGIPLSIHAELPHALPLTESDLCVLLSNALENALNACRRRAEQIGESGGIEVQTYEKSGKLFLQVVNDCVDTVRFEHGIPVSNQPGHGIGVRSICAIAERYGGIYSFAVQNGRFLLRVSL